MKILALVTDAFRSSGGIAQYNRYLFSALSKANPSFKIVVLPRLAKLPIKDLPANTVQKLPVPNHILYILRSFLCLFADGPFDVIFCGHLFMVPLAVILAKVARIPLWLQIHGIEAFKKPSFVLRRASGHATLVTAVSRYTRRKFLSWANIAPERVRVLHDTVDSRFKPGTRPGHMVKRYDLEGKKILLTLGRLSAREMYKGVDRIINVLPRLHERHPDIAYAVAGSGDDLPRLRALAREKNVDNIARFLGWIEDSEVPEVYRMADFFAMPSTGEGFGIVFLEAAACGLPVLGGNKDGSKDALGEDRLGTMIDPDDPDDLLKGLESILEKKKHVPEAIENYTFSRFEVETKRLLEKKLCAAQIYRVPRSGFARSKNSDHEAYPG